MMLSEDDLSRLSDEEFLLYRAKELSEVSASNSKSWLILAQVLYPYNFRVQFEIYMIEKVAKNVAEAAKCLGDLIKEFPRENSLHLEIDNIMRAVQSSNCLLSDSELQQNLSQDRSAQAEDKSNYAFLSELFHALPKCIQQGLIMSAAERCTDTMSHSSLLLVLTSLFPETAPLQAHNLVDTLLSAEKRSQTPLNPYRKKLVCSVLPVLVSGDSTNNSLKVPVSLLHHLMRLSMEYYAALLFSLTNHSKNNQSSSQSTSGSQRDSEISAAWNGLYNTIRTIGSKLGWIISPYFNGDTNREMMLQRVKMMLKNALGGGRNASDEVLEEALYVTTTLFLNAILEYTAKNERETANNYKVLLGVTLVEAFVSPHQVGGGGSSRSSSVCSDDLDVLSPPRAKRHRTSQDTETLVPHISVGEAEGVNGALLPLALTTGIKCWDLIHSHPKLKVDFNSLMERLRIGPTLRYFTTDMLLHDARLTECSRDLREMIDYYQARDREYVKKKEVEDLIPPFSSLECLLKLASVNYSLNNFSGAADCCNTIMQQIPHVFNGSGFQIPPTYSSTCNLTHTGGAERHLHILPITHMNILEFVITIFINCLRTRVVTQKFQDDLSIGHLLILIQYDWPKYENIFNELVNIIAKQGSFSYEFFLCYFVQPDMLEELLFLSGREGGSLSLEILPPTPNVKQQRTVSTRMGDRGSKQDFKEAMKKQVLRCEECISLNVSTFILSEGGNIQRILM